MESEETEDAHPPVRVDFQLDSSTQPETAAESEREETEDALPASRADSQLSQSQLGGGDIVRPPSVSSSKDSLVVQELSAVHSVSGSENGELRAGELADQSESDYGGTETSSDHHVKATLREAGAMSAVEEVSTPTAVNVVSPATREVFNKGDVMMVSEDCQTLWSVMDDLKVFGHELPMPELEATGVAQRKESSQDDQPPTVEGSVPSFPTESHPKSTEQEIHSQDAQDDESIFDEEDETESMDDGNTMVTDDSVVPKLRDIGGELSEAVGPPRILRRKRESRQAALKYPPLTEREKEDGIFSGHCEFCQNEIKPFPSVEDQLHMHPREIFCCDDYALFMQFALRKPFGKQYDVDVQKFVMTYMDIQPHAPYNKQARKVAKERAALRMRERELERQKKAVGQLQQQQQQIQQQNYQQAAQRALKVINFSLGSKKCAEEGYILDPKPPRDDLIDFDRHFRVDSSATPGGETQRFPKEGVKQCFYHGSEQLFYVLFSDGSGTVYYESGRPAIVVASNSVFVKKRGAEPNPAGRRLVYLALSDEKRQAVLATFQPDGNAACYSPDSNLRLHMDPCGGILFGGQSARKRWSWLDFLEIHQHTPPLQPIILSLSPCLSLRIANQNSVMLGFRSGQNALRFNVGVKLKLTTGKSQLPKLFEKSNDVIYLADMRTYTQAVMDKIQNVLKYKTEIAEKLPPPPYLLHQLEKRNITGAPKWGAKKTLPATASAV